MYGPAAAYGAGVAATSGPWLVGTATFLWLRAVAGQGALLDGGKSTSVAALLAGLYAATAFVMAPIDVLLSRVTADCLYERKLAPLGAALRMALTATILLCLLVGGCAAAWWAKTGLEAALVVVLAVALGGQWMLLAMGSALLGPLRLPWTVAAGHLASMLGIWVVGSYVGAAEISRLHFLLGYLPGQVLGFSLLLVPISARLSSVEVAHRQWRSALSSYRWLAAAALAYYAALWADKFVIWQLADPASAWEQAALCSLAWLSVIPASAWLFIETETRFSSAVQALSERARMGGNLIELETLDGELRAVTRAVLATTTTVQIVVTLLALLAAPFMLSWAALASTPLAVASLRWCLLGAAAQFFVLTSLIMLYFFDRRGWAALLGFAQLGATILGAVICVKADLLPGFGYAFSSSIGALVGFFLVFRAVHSALPGLFRTQAVYRPQGAIPHTLDEAAMRMPTAMGMAKRGPGVMPAPAPRVDAHADDDAGDDEVDPPTTGRHRGGRWS